MKKQIIITKVFLLDEKKKEYLTFRFCCERIAKTQNLIKIIVHILSSEIVEIKHGIAELFLNGLQEYDTSQGWLRRNIGFEEEIEEQDINLRIEIIYQTLIELDDKNLKKKFEEWVEVALR